MIMAKNNNEVYAPGELSRVRDKLGVKDDAEAKRMASLLGGEVGTERNADVADSKKNTLAGDKVSKRIRRIDVPLDDDIKSKSKRTEPYPGDDPSVPSKLSYRERIKIDQYAGQLIFEIKSSLSVLKSIFSFFREPVDFINPRFVTIRMNEYYNKIERMVYATRSLFPKSNTKRNNQLRRASPFVYKLFDTMRGWDIEQLSKNIAELQSHPRSVTGSDFSDILRLVYKPMFILEEIKLEDIKSAYKLIYKILYIESPMEAKEKYQEIIRNIIASYVDIRKHVHFGLYPILMRLISDRFIDYERFFIERRRRVMAFLNITETEQLDSSEWNAKQIDNIDIEAIQNESDDENNEISEDGQEHGEADIGEDLNDPKVIERITKEDAAKSEYRTMEQARSALGALFPKAGWDRLEEFPDLYPYFANIYNMKQGYELIAPCDPLHQISILLNILDDLFIGLRYVNFSIVEGSDGTMVKVSDEIGDTVNNWRGYIEDSFSRDYLPRLTDYCRVLENTKDTRSAYAKKSMNELHWIKRLYFLPYYKFESIGPPPLQKNEVIPIYSEVRKLRKYLTLVAKGIEQGIHAGGAAAKAPCSGINNPWAAYNFQVPSPVSRRMEMMLQPERKINATIIFFSLSVVTLLDQIVNNENSWAYTDRPGPVFRSVKNEGIIPVFGVDEKLDADKIFKDSLRKTQH